MITSSSNRDAVWCKAYYKLFSCKLMPVWFLVIWYVCVVCRTGQYHIPSPEQGSVLDIHGLGTDPSTQHADSHDG